MEQEMARPMGSAQQPSQSHDCLSISPIDHWTWRYRIVQASKTLTPVTFYRDANTDDDRLWKWNDSCFWACDCTQVSQLSSAEMLFSVDIFTVGNTSHPIFLWMNSLPMCLCAAFTTSRLSVAGCDFVYSGETMWKYSGRLERASITRLMPDNSAWSNPIITASAWTRLLLFAVVLALQPQLIFLSQTCVNCSSLTTAPINMISIAF